MINTVKRKFSEPSTYGGLAAITYGVGEVLKINEAAEIAHALEGAGQAIAASPDGNGLMIGITSIVFGILGVFFGEKGKR